VSNGFVIHDNEWVKQLQTDFEFYLDKCSEQVYEDTADDFKTLSGEPFCGCNVCETRETLFFLIPRLLTGAEEGKVTLAK